MENKIHIIAYHGWGFDASFWKPVKNMLPGSIHFEAADRGYYSSPAAPSFDCNEKSKKIVFAHSFGLHWCPDDVLSKADHLVIFGGFLNFHPNEKNEHRRSRLVLRQMLAQFVELPETVLEQFYKNSFHPHRKILEVPGAIQHDLLLNDLSLLDMDEAKQQRFFDLQSVTILHGSEDLIVNRDNAREMYHTLRYRSQYFEILKAGHAFPVTHAEKCSEILNTVLES